MGNRGCRFRNYLRLGDVNICCCIDYEWLDLIPKTLSFESNMRDYLMVELDSNIALATMTCILEANLYELHSMDK